MSQQQCKIVEKFNSGISVLEDHFGPPAGRKVKRTASDVSIASHVSRNSSQYWSDMVIDDESLRMIEDTEAQALAGLECGETAIFFPAGSIRINGSKLNINKELEEELEGTRSRYRRDCVGGFEKSIVELVEDFMDGGRRGVCPGKRSFGDFEGDSTAYVAAQRRKVDPPLVTADVSEDDAPWPVIIAHSDRHQNFFNKFGLSWGVQWEIARLVSSHRTEYDDIPIDVLRGLAGPSAVAAPEVESRLCSQKGNARRRQTYANAFAKELNVTVRRAFGWFLWNDILILRSKTPWAELDREEGRLKEDPLSGLGANDDDDWYGGKVAFTAKLRQRDSVEKDVNDDPRYFLELDTPELGTSTRFTRRWGSRRFIRVRIPESIIYQSNNQLLEYFKNDFVVHGKVFRPYYAKEHNVFLFQRDRIYTHGHFAPDLHDSVISFHQFLEWHNPMGFNKNQPLAKWCARLALGLSNSVPGVKFEPENIYEIDDLYSPAGHAAILAGRKPESKDITTDGTGFTNQATLVSLKYRFNWDLVPSAIQFRLGGAKGLLLLHPDDNGSCNEPCSAWIRPSQKKIAYEDNGRPPDRACLILDVLRRSHLKRPARLSTEIIVNLAQNGVPYETFEGLMKEGLECIASSMTQWSGQYAMQHLWSVIASLNGSVIRSRMSREAAGSSRVLGFSSRDEEEEDDEDEDRVESYARSKAWWADEISGCPSSLEETVLVLLDSGFEPQSSAILAMKLKEVFKKALNSYIERYKIVIPRSAEAWIVPDPCCVLGPGEIFFKTSECLVGQDGLSRDHLLGDVLVTRHPCRVPSDVQKVRAVWKNELRKYCDVIIFSVQGDRSLASMLGGGDYDGDTAHVIWEPTIIAAFRDPDNKFADPPPGLDEAFAKDTITVEDFLMSRKELDKPPATSIMVLQDYLLAAVKNSSLVGQYSSWHDNAVYKHGYDHYEAWRLAYMFCTVLDSSKTGKTVKPDVLKRDRQSYWGSPAWKRSPLEEHFSNLPPKDEALRRQGSMSQIKFIMDYLKDAGRTHYDHHMAKFEKELAISRQQYKEQRGIQTPGLYVDPALEAPWLRAMERAQRLIDEDNCDRMMRELCKIRDHVKIVRENHRELLSKDSRGRARHAFTEKSIEKRQNILRELSLSFHQMPDHEEILLLSPEEVKRYAASYAYILETGYLEKRFPDETRYSRFPFDVAMRELGNIKAESIGPCKTVMSDFYSVFNVTGAIKVFRPANRYA